MNENSREYRQATDIDYRQRIDRVLRYIREHRGATFQLEELARVAHFSRFHFHRIFAAYMGETVAEYVRRIRLEQAALELLGSPIAVADIALAAGYDTHAAFAKAFKKHFGVSPSAYREMGQEGAQPAPTRQPDKPRRRRGSMQPDIRELPERTVHCVTRKGIIDGTYDVASTEAFGVLGKFICSNNLSEVVGDCLGIIPDEPSLVSPEESRFQAGIIFKCPVVPTGEVEVVTLPAGRWAVFTHKGPYNTLPQSWSSAYRDWLPASGERLRDTAPYEVYLNEPAGTPPEELLTEIHIPVE